MGIVVVDVMLKSEILDPQGQAVAGALPRLGFNQFTDVRQGKRFELTVDGEVTDEVLAAAREAAETMLSNPVIEDVVSVSAQSGGPVSRQAAATTEGRPEAESDAEFLA
jgi:phosphoribosylformylglycinamidine synthase